MPKKRYALPRNYTGVGNYLRDCRLNAGLTQREVSIALGYSSAQFISNFEVGIAVPPLKKLRVLQKLFQMDIDRLIKITLDSEREIMKRFLGLPKAKASEATGSSRHATPIRKGRSTNFLQASY